MFYMFGYSAIQQMAEFKSRFICLFYNYIRIGVGRTQTQSLKTKRL